MIAVWLVGPPRSVTSATTSSGSRPAVSAGREVLGDEHRGLDGVGTPGSGSPTRWATRRRSMSWRSVTRSAIRPPMLVKTVDELRPPRHATAATSGVPWRQVLDHRRAQALVPGQAGARREHLGRRARAPRPPWP